MVGRGTNVETVREVMAEFRLGIDGYLAQARDPTPSADRESSVRQAVQRLSMFARVCSIFLRRLVLDERGRRGARLLSDDLCRDARLSFPRIRKIPAGRQNLTVASFELLEGNATLAFTPDDQPETTFTRALPLQPIRFEFSVEWPLPGMANWIEQPTPERPWQLGPDELFDLQSSSRLDCSNWLGQQLVLMNGRGVSLGEIVRVTANTEGAHSPPSIPLFHEEDQRDTRALRNSHVHLVNLLTVVGMNYNHVVVMETAQYLYAELLRNEFITHPSDRPRSVTMPGMSFNIGTPVFSEPGNWLGFAGSVSMGFGSQRREQVYQIKAPR